MIPFSNAACSLTSLSQHDANLYNIADGFTRWGNGKFVNTKLQRSEREVSQSIVMHLFHSHLNMSQTWPNNNQTPFSRWLVTDLWKFQFTICDAHFQSLICHNHVKMSTITSIQRTYVTNTKTSANERPLGTFGQRSNCDGDETVTVSFAS